MCFWKQDKSVKTIEDIALLCDSPQKVVAWVRRNIWYNAEKRGTNYWQTSQETLDLRSGDCEDFATLISDVLNLLGIENYILGVFIGKKTGHAVCVYKYNNTLYASSNWKTIYILESKDEINDMATRVYKNWTTASVYLASNIKDGKNIPLKRIFRQK